MPLFISDRSQASYAGVFAIETPPPPVVAGAASGYIGLVGQFAWGPDNVIVQPTSGADFWNMYEPPGSPRSSTGCRALLAAKQFTGRIVRVLHSDAVAASDSLACTGGAAVSTAKYKGTLGNSISRQIRAAASGDATKRDFVFTLTDPYSGSTVETFYDVPLPTGGVAVSVDCSASLLLASLVIAGTVTAWPANGTTNLASGSNGTAATATDYTGTQGSADKGVALFETQTDVRVVCHDDCGDSIRDAVNVAFIAHAQYMTDRQAVVDLPYSAASWTAVKAALTGSYVTDWAIVLGAWAQVYDGTGALVTAPWSVLVACALVNLKVNQSHAWWDDTATNFYTKVQGVVANFSFASPQVRKEALALGILLPIKRPSGRWALQHDRTTSQTSGKKFSVRRRSTNYFALSLTSAFDSWTNGPNTLENQRLASVLTDDFLKRQWGDGLIQTNTDGTPAYSLSIAAVNTAASMAAGEFAIGCAIQTPGVMEKIFFLLNVGETVTVTAQ